MSSHSSAGSIATDALSEQAWAAAQGIMEGKGGVSGAPLPSALPMRWVEPACGRLEFADLATPAREDGSPAGLATQPAPVLEAGCAPPVLTSPMERVMMAFAAVARARRQRSGESRSGARGGGVGKRRGATPATAAGTAAARDRERTASAHPFMRWALHLFTQGQDDPAMEADALHALAGVLAASPSLCLVRDPRPALDSFEQGVWARLLASGAPGTAPADRARPMLSALLATATQRGSVGGLAQAASYLLRAAAWSSASEPQLSLTGAGVQALVHVTSNLRGRSVAAPVADGACVRSCRSAALAWFFKQSAGPDAPPAIRCSVATDGTYLYVHCVSRIAKVGTGLNGTTAGKLVGQSRPLFGGDGAALVCVRRPGKDAQVQLLHSNWDMQRRGHVLQRVNVSTLMPGPSLSFNEGDSPGTYSTLLSDGRFVYGVRQRPAHGSAAAQHDVLDVFDPYAAASRLDGNAPVVAQQLLPSCLDAPPAEQPAVEVVLSSYPTGLQLTSTRGGVLVIAGFKHDPSPQASAGELVPCPAHMDGRLGEGQVLVSINGSPVRGMTPADALAAIAAGFEPQGRRGAAASPRGGRSGGAVDADSKVPDHVQDSKGADPGESKGTAATGAARALAETATAACVTLRVLLKPMDGRGAPSPVTSAAGLVSPPRAPDHPPRPPPRLSGAPSPGARATGASPSTAGRGGASPQPLATSCVYTTGTQVVSLRASTAASYSRPNGSQALPPTALVFSLHDDATAASRHAPTAGAGRGAGAGTRAAAASKLSFSGGFALAPRCLRASEASAAALLARTHLRPRVNHLASSRHVGVTCDVCGTHPITGPRYKDLDRYDYDLCHACYEAGSSDTSHRFRLMERPGIVTRVLPPRDQPTASETDFARAMVPSAAAYDCDNDLVWCVYTGTGEVQAWRNSGPLRASPVGSDAAPGAVAVRGTVAPSTPLDAATAVIASLGRMARVYLSGAMDTVLAAQEGSGTEPTAADRAGLPTQVDDSSIVPLPTGWQCLPVAQAPTPVYLTPNGQLMGSIPAPRGTRMVALQPLQVLPFPSLGAGRVADDTDVVAGRGYGGAASPRAVTINPGDVHTVVERAGEWYRLKPFALPSARFQAPQLPPTTGPDGEGQPLAMLMQHVSQLTELTGRGGAGAGAAPALTSFWVRASRAAVALADADTPGARPTSRPSPSPSSASPVRGGTTRARGPPQRQAASPSPSGPSQLSVGMEFTGNGRQQWNGRPEWLLGARVSVLWARGRWFEGVVVEYQHPKHFIQYNDGDQRWYAMAEKTFRIVELPDSVAGSHDGDDDDMDVEAGAGEGGFSVDGEVQEAVRRGGRRGGVILDESGDGGTAALEADNAEDDARRRMRRSGFDRGRSAGAAAGTSSDAGASAGGSGGGAGGEESGTAAAVGPGPVPAPTPAFLPFVVDVRDGASAHRTFAQLVKCMAALHIRVRDTGISAAARASACESLLDLLHVTQLNLKAALDQQAAAGGGPGAGPTSASGEAMDDAEASAALFDAAFSAVSNGEAARAAALFRRCAAMDPADSSCCYNLACCHSILATEAATTAASGGPADLRCDGARGHVEAGLYWLAVAVQRGFGKAAWAERDDDLWALHSDPRFFQILDAMGGSGGAAQGAATTRAGSPAALPVIAPPPEVDGDGGAERGDGAAGAGADASPQVAAWTESLCAFLIDVASLRVLDVAGAAGGAAAAGAEVRAGRRGPGAAVVDVHRAAAALQRARRDAISALVSAMPLLRDSPLVLRRVITAALPHPEFVARLTDALSNHSGALGGSFGAMLRGAGGQTLVQALCADAAVWELGGEARSPSTPRPAVVLLSLLQDQLLRARDQITGRGGAGDSGHDSSRDGLFTFAVTLLSAAAQACEATVVACHSELQAAGDDADGGAEQRTHARAAADAAVKRLQRTFVRPLVAPLLLALLSEPVLPATVAQPLCAMLRHLDLLLHVYSACPVDAGAGGNGADETGAGAGAGAGDAELEAWASRLAHLVACAYNRCLRTTLGHVRWSAAEVACRRWLTSPMITAGGGAQAPASSPARPAPATTPASHNTGGGGGGGGADVPAGNDGFGSRLAPELALPLMRNEGRAAALVKALSEVVGPGPSLVGDRLQSAYDTGVRVAVDVLLHAYGLGDASPHVVLLAPKRVAADVWQRAWEAGRRVVLLCRAGRWHRSLLKRAGTARHTPNANSSAGVSGAATFSAASAGGSGGGESSASLWARARKVVDGELADTSDVRRGELCLVYGVTRERLAVLATRQVMQHWANPAAQARGHPKLDVVYRRVVRRLVRRGALLVSAVGGAAVAARDPTAVCDDAMAFLLHPEVPVPALEQALGTRRHRASRTVELLSGLASVTSGLRTPTLLRDVVAGVGHAVKGYRAVTHDAGSRRAQGGAAREWPLPRHFLHSVAGCGPQLTNRVRAAFGDVLKWCATVLARPLQTATHAPGGDRATARLFQPSRPSRLDACDDGPGVWVATALAAVDMVAQAYMLGDAGLLVRTGVLRPLFALCDVAHRAHAALPSADAGAIATHGSGGAHQHVWTGDSGLPLLQDAAQRAVGAIASVVLSWAVPDVVHNAMPIPSSPTAAAAASTAAETAKLQQHVCNLTLLALTPPVDANAFLRTCREESKDVGIELEEKDGAGGGDDNSSATPGGMRSGRVGASQGTSDSAAAMAVSGLAHRLPDDNFLHLLLGVLYRQRASAAVKHWLARQSAALQLSTALLATLDHSSDAAVAVYTLRVRRLALGLLRASLPRRYPGGSMGRLVEAVLERIGREVMLVDQPTSAKPRPKALPGSPGASMPTSPVPGTPGSPVPSPAPAPGAGSGLVQLGGRGGFTRAWHVQDGTVVVASAACPPLSVYVLDAPAGGGGGSGGGDGTGSRPGARCLTWRAHNSARWPVTVTLTVTASDFAVPANGSHGAGGDEGTAGGVDGKRKRGAPVQLPAADIAPGMSVVLLEVPSSALVTPQATRGGVEWGDFSFTWTTAPVATPPASAADGADTDDEVAATGGKPVSQVTALASLHMSPPPTATRGSPPPPPPESLMRLASRSSGGAVPRLSTIARSASGGGERDRDRDRDHDHDRDAFDVDEDVLAAMAEEDEAMGGVGQLADWVAQGGPRRPGGDGVSSAQDIIRALLGGAGRGRGGGPPPSSPGFLPQIGRTGSHDGGGAGGRGRGGNTADDVESRVAAMHQQLMDAAAASRDGAEAAARGLDIWDEMEAEEGGMGAPPALRARSNSGSYARRRGSAPPAQAPAPSLPTRTARGAGAGAGSGAGSGAGAGAGGGALASPQPNPARIAESAARSKRQYQLVVLQRKGGADTAAAARALGPAAGGRGFSRDVAAAALAAVVAQGTEPTTHALVGAAMEYLGGLEEGALLPHLGGRAPPRAGGDAATSFVDLILNALRPNDLPPAERDAIRDKLVAAGDALRITIADGTYELCLGMARALAAAGITCSVVEKPAGTCAARNRRRVAAGTAVVRVQSGGAAQVLLQELVSLAHWLATGAGPTWAARSANALSRGWSALPKWASLPTPAQARVLGAVMVVGEPNTGIRLGAHVSLVRGRLPAAGHAAAGAAGTQQLLPPVGPGIGLLRGSGPALVLPPVTGTVVSVDATSQQACVLLHQAASGEGSATPAAVPTAKTAWYACDWLQPATRDFDALHAALAAVHPALLVGAAQFLDQPLPPLLQQLAAGGSTGAAPKLSPSAGTAGAAERAVSASPASPTPAAPEPALRGHSGPAAHHRLWLVRLLRRRVVQAVHSIIEAGAGSSARVQQLPSLTRQLRALASCGVGATGEVTAAQLQQRSQRALRDLHDVARREAPAATGTLGAGDGPVPLARVSSSKRPRPDDGDSGSDAGDAGADGVSVASDDSDVGAQSRPQGWNVESSWHTYFVDGVALPAGSAGGAVASGASASKEVAPSRLASAQFAGFTKRDEDPRRGDGNVPGRRTEDVVLVADAPIPATARKFYFEVTLVDVEHSSRDGPSVCVGLWSDTPSNRGMHGLEWGEGCWFMAGRTGAKAEWRPAASTIQYAVGEPVDVKDMTGTVTWRPSIIVAKRDGAVQVHFFGWESKWDEWIETSPERLAPFRSHTHGVRPSGWFRHADYGTPFMSRGDCVGCLWDLDTATVHFTVNGEPQGLAFTGVRGELVPAVSLSNQHARVALNVGQAPFRYYHLSLHAAKLDLDRAGTGGATSPGEVVEPAVGAAQTLPLEERVALFKRIAADRRERAAKVEEEVRSTLRSVPKARRPKACKCWKRRGAAMELSDMLPDVSVPLIMRVLHMTGDDKQRAAEWLLSHNAGMGADAEDEGGDKCAGKTHLVLTGGARPGEPNERLLEHCCANFAGLVPPAPGITLPLASADPINAATPIANRDAVAGKGVLIDRGGCTFVTKARHAQQAGAAALILVSDSDVSFIPDRGSDPCEDLTIPVVMVTHDSGTMLKAAVAAGQDVHVTLKCGWDVDVNAEGQTGTAVAVTTPVRAMTASGAGTGAGAGAGSSFRDGGGAADGGHAGASLATERDESKRDVVFDPEASGSFVRDQVFACNDVPGLVDAPVDSGRARGASIDGGPALSAAEEEWLSSIDGRLRRRRVPGATRQMILSLLRQGGENNLAMARSMLEDVYLELPPRPDVSVAEPPSHAALGQTPPGTPPRRTRTWSIGESPRRPGSHGMPTPGGASTTGGGGGSGQDAAGSGAEASNPLGLPPLSLDDVRLGMRVLVNVTGATLALWRTQASNTGGDQQPAAPVLTEGTQVKARWSGGGWYDARVSQVHPDNTYDVQYSDGDAEANLTLDRLRVVQPDGTLVRAVKTRPPKASTAGDVWVAGAMDDTAGACGVVAGVDRQDAAVLVRFDDEERHLVREWWYPPSLLCEAPFDATTAGGGAADEAATAAAAAAPNGVLLPTAAAGAVAVVEDQLCSLHARQAVLALLPAATGSAVLAATPAAAQGAGVSGTSGETAATRESAASVDSGGSGGMELTPATLRLLASQCFGTGLSPVPVDDSMCPAPLADLAPHLPRLLGRRPTVITELLRATAAVAGAGSFDLTSSEPSQRPNGRTPLLVTAALPASMPHQIAAIVVSFRGDKGVSGLRRGSLLAFHPTRAATVTLRAMSQRDSTESCTTAAAFMEQVPLVVPGNRVWIRRQGAAEYELRVTPVPPEFGLACWLLDRYLRAAAATIASPGLPDATPATQPTVAGAAVQPAVAATAGVTPKDAAEVLGVAIDGLLELVLAPLVPANLRTTALRLLARAVWLGADVDVITPARVASVLPLLREASLLHERELRAGRRMEERSHSRLLVALVEVVVAARVAVGASAWQREIASGRASTPRASDGAGAGGAGAGGSGGDAVSLAPRWFDQAVELVQALRWLDGAGTPHQPVSFLQAAWKDHATLVATLFADADGAGGAARDMDEATAMLGDEGFVCRAADRLQQFTRPHDEALVEWATEAFNKAGAGRTPSMAALDAVATFQPDSPLAPPLLAGEKFPAVALQLRFLVLRHLNQLLQHAWPIVLGSPVDALGADGTSVVASLVRACRGLAFTDVKQRVIEAALRATAVAAVARRPKVKVNRFTAVSPRCVEETVFGQVALQLATVPPQLLRQQHTSPHLSFEVQLLKERVAGESGPYREVFGDVCRELGITGFDAAAAGSAAVPAGAGAPADGGGSHNPAGDEGDADGESEALGSGGSDTRPKPSALGASTVLRMFVPCGNAAESWSQNRDAVVPNPSDDTPQALELFRTLGRLLGVAIRTGVRLPIVWPSTVWKPLCGDVPTLRDLAACDTRAADHVVARLRACDTEDEFEEAFGSALTHSTFLSDGTLVQRVHGGADLPVKFQERLQYAAWVEGVRLHEADAQLAAMRHGIGEVVPLAALDTLTWTELSLRVCGSREVDVDMLYRHTEYGAGVDRTAPYIASFWSVLRSFTNTQRLRFVRFAWGQERLPTTDRGYAAANVRMLIKAWPRKPRGSPPTDTYLPHADTCFFNIALPPYSSERVMRRQLLAAISADWGLDGDQVAGH